MLPLIDEDLPDNPLFLTRSFQCMGVLYHRRDPIDQFEPLQASPSQRRANWVLETLIIPNGAEPALKPGTALCQNAQRLGGAEP